MRDAGIYLAQARNLPSLPAVSKKVGELLEKPTSSAADFGVIISQDQALSSKLLKLVNSALFGLSEHVESISRAVALVGFRQIRDLVTGMSVIQSFKGLESDSLNMKAFWEHSLACGVSSQVLAVYLQLPAAETCFTAGLLHDVGKLVLLANNAAEYNEVLRLNQDGVLNGDAERRIFDLSHAELGARLAAMWNYPPSFQDAVAFHHRPDLSGGFQVLTSIVHISDVIVHSLELGYSGEQFVPPLNMEACGAIGLRTSMLAPAIERIEHHVNAVKSSFLD